MARLIIPEVVWQTISALEYILGEDLPIPHQVSLPEDTGETITDEIKFYFGNGFKIKALIQTGISEQLESEDDNPEVERYRWVIPLNLSYEMLNLPENEDARGELEDWFCELEDIVGKILREVQEDTLIFNLSDEQTYMLFAHRNWQLDMTDTSCNQMN